jgi:hypothetical protein
VLDEHKTTAQVARDLDLTESAAATWVKRERANRTNGKTGQSWGPLREGEQVKFALVEAEKANYPVTTICRALGVSTSGL